MQISPCEFFRRDLTLPGSFALNGDIPLALDWMRAGRVQAEPLITHRLPLSHVVGAQSEGPPGLRSSQKALFNPRRKTREHARLFPRLREAPSMKVISDVT